MMAGVKRIVSALVNSSRYCVSLRTRETDAVDRPAVPAAVTAWGLVSGLIFCAVFAGSWKYFGDIYFSEYSRLRLVPSAMVLLTSSVLGFNQILGLAVTVDRLVLGGRASETRTREALSKITLAGLLAMMLIILLKFSALLAMPYHTPWWPGGWRRFFNPLYPRMHFRVLILMGLWGKASLLIAGAVGSQSPSIAAQDRVFRRAMGIKKLLINLIFVVGVTAIYFSSGRNRGLGVLVSLSIFLVIYLASMIISRRQGGHDRYSMFACAELGEVGLLLTYLAISRFL